MVLVIRAGKTSRELVAMAPEPKEPTRSIQVIKGMSITESTFKSDHRYQRKPLTKYSMAKVASN